MIKTKNGNISVEEFTQICKESESVREVVQKLGYAPNGGGTAKRIKELIIQNGIDISHFNGQGHTKNIGKSFNHGFEKRLMKIKHKIY